MEAIKRWARQILQGLVYLHSRDPPVIHRDIKCDNIFVNGHLAQVKIGDLGLAAILHGSQSAHTIIGTPEFMAPELYKEEYNELVDVYSFGMCMLEMLTSEYPYSECINPVQIFMKVESGKKPNVFYQIQDMKAQQFIAKCLEAADKRPTAEQLLLDPFLATNESILSESVPPLQIFSPRGEQVKAQPSPSLLLDHQPIGVSKAMTFSGELKPDGKTIFLKLHIIDSNGHARNVQFSFDIEEEEAMDVATEMVNELDITDWEPLEIANMIESEISTVFPTWKDHVLSIRKQTDQEKEADEENGKMEPAGLLSSNKDEDISSSSRALGSSRFSYTDENTDIIGEELDNEKQLAKRKTNRLRSFNEIGRQVMQKLALKQGWRKSRSSKAGGSVEGI